MDTRDWDGLSVWRQDDRIERLENNRYDDGENGAVPRLDPLLGARGDSLRHGFGYWGVGWGLQNSGGGPQGYGWEGGWQGGHGEITRGGRFAGGWAGAPEIADPSTSGYWPPETPGDRRDYRGRAPKNYVRSDERVEEAVHERLTLHPEVDATDIEVRVENGEVTLEGRVPDRETKRLAERAIEFAPGVRDVHNRLTIAQRAQRSLPGSAEGI